MKIEMRKRLGICQFYLYFDSNPDSYPEEGWEIIVTKDEVRVNSECICTGINVVPDSLSVLTYSNNILRFRIRVNQDTASRDTSSSASCTTFDYRELCTQLKAGDSTMLTCFQCHSQIMHHRIKIRYISPAVDLSDIFCHRDTNTMEFEKADFSQSTSNDIVVQYDTGSISLPHFAEGNLNLLESSGVFHCRRCFSWLGIRSYDNHNTLRFWDDTVKFTNTTNALTQERISRYIFRSLIRKAIVECLFPICNILLKNHDNSKEECIFISILDRNLVVLEYEGETAMEETSYLKVLFEIMDTKDAEKEHVIHQIEIISKPTFLYVFKTLLSMRETASNDENVAFLKIT